MSDDMFANDIEFSDPEKQIKSVQMLDGEIHEMQILLGITLGYKNEG